MKMPFSRRGVIDHPKAAPFTAFPVGWHFRRARGDRTDAPSFAGAVPLPISGKTALPRILCLLLALFFPWGPLLGQRLFVFHPTTIRPNILEKKLQEYLPGVQITVFGRYFDFVEQVRRDPPDAIVTNPVLVAQFERFETGARGLLEGKNETAWVVLSPNRALDVAGMSTAKIGAVDILGRRDMNRFVEAMLDFLPRLKLVTKLEDLLPLLLLQMADGILVPDSAVTYFQSVSTLDLKVTRFPDARAGLTVLAVNRTRNPQGILQAFRRMPRNLCGYFGVEQWK